MPARLARAELVRRWRDGHGDQGTERGSRRTPTHAADRQATQAPSRSAALSSVTVVAGVGLAGRGLPGRSSADGPSRVRTRVLHDGSARPARRPGPLGAHPGSSAAVTGLGNDS